MANDTFIQLVRHMRHSTSFELNYRVFIDALKHCTTASATILGRLLHGQVIRLGHHTCEYVLKALLNMYAKTRNLDDCLRLFSQMRYHDPVIWNIVLSGFSGTKLHDFEAMSLFHKMHRQQEPNPSAITLAIILPIYARNGALIAGKCVHSYAVKCGLESQTLVGNVLTSMYAKSRLPSDAAIVFHEIVNKDVVSWNAAIAGFAENRLVGNALELFQWMLKGKSQPNHATVANILPLYALLDEDIGYNLGKETHCYALRRTELINEITVYNALLSFYLRMKRVKQAEILFSRMKVKDLVSWNSVIAGYSANSESLKALEMFSRLVTETRPIPDSITLISVLPACTQLGNVLMGKQIHGYVLRRNFLREDTIVQNALISFFAKCRCLTTAFKIFSLFPRRDVISWNTMLDAFVESTSGTQAADLLRQMFREGIRPDAVTMLIMIQYFSNLSKEVEVKGAHGFSLRHYFSVGAAEPTLENTLLDAYAKCGNVGYAQNLFDSLMDRRTIVTCNSMISAYTYHGLCDAADSIFRQMSERDLTTLNLMVHCYAENGFLEEALKVFHCIYDHNLKPDTMTIMSLLPICSRLASMHMLKQCHAYMLRACFDDVQIMGALVDLYSKCGSIGYAYKLFNTTPKKDLVMFTAIISGYAMHGMGKEALQLYGGMRDWGLKPDHVIITAILSACSHAGLVDQGLKIFDSIEKEHQMKPSMEQYACVVDLLARGGEIKAAYSFVTQMPVEPSSSIWGTILGACKIHHEVDIGRNVADCLLNVNENDTGMYIVMSNLFAADARWSGVLNLRKQMKMRDLKKPAGCSWIEVERRKSVFAAGDYSHPERSSIYRTLLTLDEHIRKEKGVLIPGN